MAGSPLMVPERRLYPWDTVVRCGSKLARTPTPGLANVPVTENAPMCRV